MGSSTDIASMATALGLDAGEADSFEVMLAVKALVKERNDLRAQLEALRAAVADYFRRAAGENRWGFKFPVCWECGAPTTYDGTGKGNGVVCDAHLPDHDRHDWREVPEAEAVRALARLGALPVPAKEKP